VHTIPYHVGDVERQHAITIRKLPNTQIGTRNRVVLKPDGGGIGGRERREIERHAHYEPRSSARLASHMYTRLRRERRRLLHAVSTPTLVRSCMVRLSFHRGTLAAGRHCPQPDPLRLLAHSALWPLALPMLYTKSAMTGSSPRHQTSPEHVIRTVPRSSKLLRESRLRGGRTKRE